MSTAKNIPAQAGTALYLVSLGCSKNLVDTEVIAGTLLTSVCRTHGYLAGEQHTCPHCGSKTEVYSRITGYYRPVQNWNDGKVQEFKDRKVYSMLDYREHKQRKAEAEAAAEKNASPDVAAAYTLFTTKTCPNCKAAKAILDRAGIKYDVVDAEDEPELALRYGVMQVPALVVVSFGENGSGKSTLMNILSGIYSPDAGSIELFGKPVTFSSPKDSIRAGMLDAVHHMKLGIDVFQVGRVLSVSDGICWMDGLADIMYGELVEFVNGERGMVMDIQADRVGCIIFGRYDHVDSYSRVRRLNKMASVPVGEAMLGRVVDALGKPIDGRGRIWSTETRPIEFQAPAIPDRQSVSVPLHTGIKAIDALVPIGRGQRELIIGDRQTGKTAIAIDAILAQKGQNVLCIYVAIGQKRATVAEIAARLEAAGAMEYTTIVCATASDSASLQYIAPFAGAAMSEYFMYKGRDVLIVYDDLSKHAVAYREISLLLHRPSGREAYPGDIFYLHSRLLERAARINAEAGGGSVTALPVIETQAGDISAYIPTNVISITDGQIFLETDLFNEGQRPAVNVGLSVSRVGGAAQTKLMKQVASSLRTGLAQYRELASFTQFGSDLDETTRKTLASGAKMMAALRQDRFSPLHDWQQALLIFAVSGGYADKVEADDLNDFSSQLFSWFIMKEPALTETLKTGRKLDDDTRAALHAALTAFAEAL